MTTIEPLLADQNKGIIHGHSMLDQEESLQTGSFDAADGGGDSGSVDKAKTDLKAHLQRALTCLTILERHGNSAKQLNEDQEYVRAISDLSRPLNHIPQSAQMQKMEDRIQTMTAIVGDLVAQNGLLLKQAVDGGSQKLLVSKSPAPHPNPEAMKDNKTPTSTSAIMITPQRVEDMALPLQCTQSNWFNSTKVYIHFLPNPLSPKDRPPPSEVLAVVNKASWSGCSFPPPYCYLTNVAYTHTGNFIFTARSRGSAERLHDDMKSFSYFAPLRSLLPLNQYALLSRLPGETQHVLHISSIAKDGRIYNHVFPDRSWDDYSEEEFRDTRSVEEEVIRLNPALGNFIIPGTARWTLPEVIRRCSAYQYRTYSVALYVKEKEKVEAFLQSKPGQLIYMDQEWESVGRLYSLADETIPDFNVGDAETQDGRA